MAASKSNWPQQFRDYLSAIFRHWKVLVSGVLSFVIGVVWKIIGHDPSLAVFLWFGGAMIFVATFLAWRDSDLKCALLVEELESAKKEIEALKDTRQQQRQQNLLKLWDEFEGLKPTRRKAAAYFNKWESDSGAAEDLLDFFDMRVGQFLKHGDLDLEATWGEFYHWVHHYWFAASDLYKDFTKEDDGVWENFKDLWKQVSDYQRQRQGTYAPPTPAELAKFLAEEEQRPPNRAI